MGWAGGAWGGWAGGARGDGRRRGGRPVAGPPQKQHGGGPAPSTHSLTHPSHPPTVCMILRTWVTLTPRSTMVSAIHPPTLADTAIVIHGSTE